MTQRSSWTLVAVWLWVAALPATAQSVGPGFDVSGTWESTSGNTFVISWSKTRFDLQMIDVKGKARAGTVRWVEKGKKFIYLIAGFKGSHLVTIQPDEPDVLVVEGQEGTRYWTRRPSE